MHIRGRGLNQVFQMLRTLLICENSHYRVPELLALVTIVISVRNNTSDGIVEPPAIT